MGDRPIITHRHPLVKAVAKGLRGPCDVGPGARIVVAVSGGADSVALLRAMETLARRKEWRLDLHVAHVHHHLRPDADSDAEFVRQLAAELKLPFHRRDIHPASEPGNTESAGRRLRYAALADIAAEVNADAVATGHHADDQLETILMRLIRGASVQGLGGVPPKRRLAGSEAMLVRPMLGTDHASAASFLRAIGQGWREDPTNADTARWRAKLRAEVLPALRSLRRDAAAKATESAGRLRSAARFIRSAVTRAGRKHLRPAGQTVEIDRRDCARLDALVLRGLIRRTSIRSGVPPDALPARVVEIIASACIDGSGEERRYDLAGGVRVTVGGETARWARYDPQR